MYKSEDVEISEPNRAGANSNDEHGIEEHTENMGKISSNQVTRRKIVEE